MDFLSSLDTLVEVKRRFYYIFPIFVSYDWIDEWYEHLRRCIIFAQMILLFHSALYDQALDPHLISNKGSAALRNMYHSNLLILSTMRLSLRKFSTRF